MDLVPEIPFDYFINLATAAGAPLKLRDDDSLDLQAGVQLALDCPDHLFHLIQPVAAEYMGFHRN